MKINKIDYLLVLRLDIADNEPKLDLDGGIIFDLFVGGNDAHDDAMLVSAKSFD
jgi:hypothetical protein